MLTLFDYYRSSACYRVRIALNLKKLSYDINTIHLVQDGGAQFRAQYTALNPQQLVPTLQDDNVTLTQSLAIIEYLEECYPDPPLLPKSPIEKAHVRAFALTIIADIHPINNLRILKYLTGVLHVTDEEKKEWIHHWMHVGFKAMETQLNRNDHHTNCCFSDAPSLADVCLIPQLYNARRFELDLTPYPTLVKIEQHCQKLEAFELAYPIETTTT